MMANLYVESLDMTNPFVVASSPATQGARNVLKSAKMRLAPSRCATLATAPAA